MISPLEGKPKPDLRFGVVDIENMPDGSVLHVGLSLRERGVGEIKHFVFSGWQDFLEHIIKFGRDDRSYRLLYAHNGGKWDWISLVEFIRSTPKFCREGDKHRLDMIRGAGSMVLMTLTVGQRFKIKFCDSLYLLRSKLADLTKRFGLEEGKLDLKGELPHETYKRDPSLYFTYLRRDCDSLLLVLESALELVRSIAPVATLGATIGGLALRVFKTGFLREAIPTPYPDDPLRVMYREGYTGGRVQVFRYGYHERIWEYDINSTYPYAMRSLLVPTYYQPISVSNFRANRCGVYRVRYVQNDRTALSVFKSYVGEGVFYSPELSLLVEVDPSCEINVIEGIEFQQTDTVFQPFVDDIFKLRQANKGAAIDLLCKYLHNSLYGKLGERGERELLIMFDSFDAKIEKLREWEKKRAELGDKAGEQFVFREMTSDGLCGGLTTVNIVKHEHVFLAGMITSASRACLYRWFLKAGSENVVYCDTDSIHCKAPTLDRYVSDDLGAVKLCGPSVGREGVYCGKKIYALRTISKIGHIKRGMQQFSTSLETVRAKGVSLGGTGGGTLTFDDLLAISQGESRRVTFSKPATLTEVLNGKKSCRLNQKNRVRTIRRT